VLRRVLLILVVWPLLMPPGLCICRLGAFAPRGAKHSGAVGGQGQAEAPKRRCPCCKRAARKAASPAPACVSVSAREAPDLPPASSPPHAPACPASPNWEITRASLPPSVGHDLSESLGFAVAARWPCADEDGQSLLSPLVRAASGPGPLFSYFSCNFRC
jgi:hypothetical protein